MRVLTWDLDLEICPLVQIEKLKWSGFVAIIKHQLLPLQDSGCRDEVHPKLQGCPRNNREACSVDKLEMSARVHLAAESFGTPAE